MLTADRTNPLRVAVVGGGVSGLGAAWLLSKTCDVTLYEAASRLGGHSDTFDWDGAPVDCGFIVYNERTYPNLTALFAHLGVPTRESDMSFGVSIDDGRIEYSGSGLRGLFAQPANLLRPRHWSMLKDILRFFRDSRKDIGRENLGSLEAYLDRNGYGRAFRDLYLYPMAAAVWSTPAMQVGDYPAESFIRFSLNHGLLDVADRPNWRTVVGGSRVYVKALAEQLERVFCGRAARSVRRTENGVYVTDAAGETRRFDRVILATHADDALRMLDSSTRSERELLGAFRYIRNDAILHTDDRAMPRRRAVWSSWNYMARQGDGGRLLSVTYWMNSLQDLANRPPVFLSLNPFIDIADSRILRRVRFEHPMFTDATLSAQKRLWSLQGVGDVWFCGAYFGYGFHEDGLQAGLAVAEEIGGARRPWSVTGENDRLHLSDVRSEPGRHGQRRMIEPGLYIGSVMHRRVRPCRHRFEYRAFWLVVDLDRLETTARRLKLLSIERFNLFSFYARDHADGRGAPLRGRIASLATEAGFAADGPILLLTMPRVLGYVFNPLSVYFCHNTREQLTAIVWEVSSTFGERHSYVIGVDDPDARVHRQRCRKELHVSPFIDMEIEYRFRVAESDDALSLGIADYDNDGLLMSAAMTGRRRPLSDRELLAAFLRIPFETVKVTAAIHWEALRLWRKGASLIGAPAGRSKAIERYSASAPGTAEQTAAASQNARTLGPPKPERRDASDPRAILVTRAKHAQNGGR